MAPAGNPLRAAGIDVIQPWDAKKIAEIHIVPGISSATWLKPTARAFIASAMAPPLLSQ
jgi:hypothetical protein